MVQLAADSFLALSVVPDECAQERLYAQEAASEVAIRLPPGVLQLLESLQLTTARVRGRKLFGWQALGMPKHVNMTFERTEHMEVPVGFRDQPGMKGTERSDLLPRSVKRSARQRRRPRLYWMSDPCAVRPRSFHRPHSVMLSPAFWTFAPVFLVVLPPELPTSSGTLATFSAPRFTGSAASQFLTRARPSLRAGHAA
jgi:hypothetical protein